MRFGDANDFAIDAELEHGLVPSSTAWGRMCVWCRGESLGDLSKQYCGLNESAEGFRWLSGHLVDLWDECFECLDDRAIFNLLDHLLFACHDGVLIEDDRTLEKIKQDANRFSKFIFLTTWGEQFDGCKSFIVCPPGGPVRILSRELAQPMSVGMTVTREGFLIAIESFLNWFDDEVERLLEQR